MALPAFDPKTKVNHSPHVVILGAGASRAALPNGDASGKMLPVMRELIECLDLGPLLQSYGMRVETADFESLYDELASSGRYPDLVKEIEGQVCAYFSDLALPDRATLYDYLVLGLREKDLIATFNWDPFLVQAWQRNSRAVKLPRIVFLHGNVRIGVCMEHRVKGFMGDSCRKCGEALVPTRLLYPVKHKDYSSDPYISTEWDEFRHFLQHAYFLTIFGYAAPTTDVEARELMLSGWRENRTLELAQTEIVDIKPRRELEPTWDDFLCRTHYRICRRLRESYFFSYPRRSCEALAMATLQNSPWPDNPFPRMRNLANLQRWARLLWREERAGRLTGKPCTELEDTETRPAG